MAKCYKNYQKKLKLDKKFYLIQRLLLYVCNLQST